jgi:gas vesicle protein
MANDCKTGLGTTFVAFTLGMAIGGGLALLTAPRSGPETRKKLRNLMDETREQLHEITEDAEDRIKNVVKEGQDLLEEKADLLKAAIRAGKEAMEAENTRHEKTA